MTMRILISIRKRRNFTLVLMFRLLLDSWLDLVCAVLPQLVLLLLQGAAMFLHLPPLPKRAPVSVVAGYVEDISYGGAAHHFADSAHAIISKSWSIIHPTKFQTIHAPTMTKSNVHVRGHPLPMA